MTNLHFFKIRPFLGPDSCQTTFLDENGSGEATEDCDKSVQDCDTTLVQDVDPFEPSFLVHRAADRTICDGEDMFEESPIISKSQKTNSQVSQPVDFSRYCLCIEETSFFLLSWLGRNIMHWFLINLVDLYISGP